MKLAECTLNMAVTDRWWPFYRGRICTVTKSSVWVAWNHKPKPERYDKAHLQFLEAL